MCTSQASNKIYYRPSTSTLSRQEVKKEKWLAWELGNGEVAGKMVWGGGTQQAYRDKQ